MLASWAVNAGYLSSVPNVAKLWERALGDPVKESVHQISEQGSSDAAAVPLSWIPDAQILTRKAELKSEGVVALPPHLCPRSENEVLVALPLVPRLGIQVSTRLIWGIIISLDGIVRCSVL